MSLERSRFAVLTVNPTSVDYHFIKTKEEAK
jgi:hypothetical protein